MNKNIDLIGSLCKQSHLDSVSSVRINRNKFDQEVYYHRKVWEMIWIYNVLEQKGMLKPGKKGLGFGCGEEYLVPALATEGVDIVASDQDKEAAEKSGWIATDQHSDSLSSFEKWLPKFCDRDTFYNYVQYRCIDMNNIQDEFNDSFDFNWSACSLEHLGSLQKGIDFILNSMKTLKKGGIAVHTTEYNVSSNQETLEHPSTCIYRRQDIERLINTANQMGYKACEMDFSSGDLVYDGYIDVPPYTQDPHLKLSFEGFTCTSIGIFIEKL